MRYIEISAKGNYHVEMPVLALTRQLLCDPNLAFTSVPVRLPPEIVIDAALQERHERELAVVERIQLPYSEDDFLF
jgi:hypothetical protein